MTGQLGVAMWIDVGRKTRLSCRGSATKDLSGGLDGMDGKKETN